MVSMRLIIVIPVIIRILKRIPGISGSVIAEFMDVKTVGTDGIPAAPWKIKP